MTSTSPVVSVLESARQLGFVGPGAVELQIAHSRGFIEAMEPELAGMAPARWPGLLIDLGSGGGLPGLVLAAELEEARVVLVDGSIRRSSFLLDAVLRCGLEDRVVVLPRRGEEVGRESQYRGQADIVTARLFAAPPITAECGAPLLKDGGSLIVSEPPAPDENAPRWSADGLSELGLSLVERRGSRFRYQVLRQSGLCPSRYPRRVGVPAKRPLF